MEGIQTVVIDGEKWGVGLPYPGMKYLDTLFKDWTSDILIYDFKTHRFLRHRANGIDTGMLPGDKTDWAPVFVPLKWETEEPDGRYLNVPDGYRTTIGSMVFDGNPTICGVYPTIYAGQNVVIGDTAESARFRIPVVKSGNAFLCEKTLLHTVGLADLVDARLLSRLAVKEN